ncbi:MAG: hypothetical protein H6624_13885 [Bdellovibrionaceae bacterium]|nr:hypothetical protein [Bdellovibrionales bacterium]MCB9085431.1 hypothetical protein [Pseudobdellovibrionaceae bacterium]
MRHIGELLKELGFNPDSPLGTQKAFVRHLIQQANRMEQAPTKLPQPSPSDSAKEAQPEPKKFEQLSFNFDDSKKTG